MAAVGDFTPVDAVAGIVDEARQYFRTGATKSLEWRRTQLRAIAKLLDEQEAGLTDAIHADLGRCRGESLLLELLVARNEVGLALNNMDEWVKGHSPGTHWALKLDSSTLIKPDPLGVVAIIGPWNYPVQLTIVPLIAAIAAGNTVVIKPSEVAIHSSTCLAHLIPQYLDNDAVKIVTGGIPETTELLKQRFDKILYTGNGAVGKIVLRAAAEHLTPVLLELGGKSPVLVSRHQSDWAATARRIAWGKMMNSGQTCIAPDYILVERAAADTLVDHLKRAFDELFGGESPLESSRYSHMINDRQYNRVKALLRHGTVAYGGATDDTRRVIAPTILLEPDLDSELMTEEIFGPLLPVVVVESLDDGMRFVADRAKPLALYCFSNKASEVACVRNETTSGNFVANDTLMHAAVAELPFGGIGGSGAGAYHGVHGFHAFSHLKGCLMRNASKAFEAAMTLRYPPLSAKKISMLERVLVTREQAVSSKVILALVGSAGIAAAALARPEVIDQARRWFGL